VVCKISPSTWIYSIRGYYFWSTVGVKEYRSTAAKPHRPIKTTTKPCNIPNYLYPPPPPPPSSHTIVPLYDAYTVKGDIRDVSICGRDII
jgi:hypothetical protein